MIDAYSWRTSNGRKLHIVLEELELEYHIHPIDIRKGDQFEPEFLKISPNNKIPAIVDQDGPGGNPTRCSNRAPSSCTSPRKPAGSCPRT